MATSRDRVRLNVGGETFETSTTTLARAGTDSSLYTLVRDQLILGTEIFIDGNPDYFGVLLDLLRTGHLDIPEGMTKDSVFRQAKLYGLEGRVRAAMRPGDLNGNLLRLSHSMTCSDPPDYYNGFIRASPAGGFCVGHSDVVRTYSDWNLKEELPPICCGGISSIVDVVWCDARTIAISTDSAMGLFSTVTGELSHCFSKTAPSQRHIGNLCTNSSSKEIFSAYTLENRAAEVGAWDQVTGGLKSIVNAVKNEGYVVKLLWISGINCLLRMSEACSLCFVDPRTRQEVAESGDIVSPWSKRMGMADVAVNEASSNICLMDSLMNVGFLDYRKLSALAGKDVRWMSEYSDSKRRAHDLPQSLLCHEGQLFAKRECSMSVFTEKKLPAPGSRFSRTWSISGISRIRDISIGGDRLFLLHKHDDGLPDVVNVWETPRSSLI